MKLSSLLLTGACLFGAFHLYTSHVVDKAVKQARTVDPGVQTETPEIHENTPEEQLSDSVSKFYAEQAAMAREIHRINEEAYLRYEEKVEEAYEQAEAARLQMEERMREAYAEERAARIQRIEESNNQYNNSYYPYNEKDTEYRPNYKKRKSATMYGYGY